MADYESYAKGSPLEVKVISKRFGIPNSTSLDVSLANDGYKALEKALGMTPEEVIAMVKDQSTAPGLARTSAVHQNGS